MNYNEHCIITMARMPSDHVNLIMTSPPYANARKKTYGGIPEDKYIDWFMPISKELQRILKPDGSFILNIKENAIGGQRSTYVLELVLAMKKQGWLWTEEYIWHKKSCMPGKYPNRFRDAWEHIYHFTINKKFKMNQDDVMIPSSEATKKRIKNPSKNDSINFKNKTKSGFSVKKTNWIGRDKVYPTNVLHLAPETGNQKHSAAYPISLPTWFIKLFSDKGDLVYDPFTGSGTTGKAAIDLQRQYIGSEINEEYYNNAKVRMAQKRLK